MFIATLFTVAKVWKQPKCPSIDEWIIYILYIHIYIYMHTHTVEYYSAIKRSETLSFAASWMDFGGHYAK